MAAKAEAGDIGGRRKFQFLNDPGACLVQSGSVGDDGFFQFVRPLPAGLDGCGQNACSKGFCQEKDLSRTKIRIGGEIVRVNQA